MKRNEEALEKEREIAAIWDMLYLVQCGINSITPDLNRVAKMNLEKVYARSKSQSLEALTCRALESLVKSNPQIQIADKNQTFLQWKEAKNKSIAKNLMMDAAREQLFAFLEKRGIWHMILKGTVLCRMYPEYGTRQIADNDILFDSAFRQEVHDWFVEQGYDVWTFQKNNHDQYHKKPVYNFEMHVSLFRENEQSQLAQYYRSVKEKLIRKPDKKFEYSMTDEDFYLYIVAHIYKHYAGKGTGLRSLLDIYIYNKKKDHMDRKYLDQEFDKMGILAFENEFRNLAQKILAPEATIEALSEKEQDMLEEVLFSYTYGTIQKYWNYQLRMIDPNRDNISAGIKFRYLIHRLFPSRAEMEQWCEQYAPYFLRHKRLMPAARVWRIVKASEKGKKIKAELRTIKKA